MSRIPALLAFAWLCAAPSPAQAEVIERSPGGFTVRTTLPVAAPADVVYRALVQEIAMWWDADHTFSGDAANLRLEARPGGCFCERLPDGGGVEHAVVVNAVPGELLRLRGALGPLQGAGVAGALTWQLTPGANGSASAGVTYVVGGYYPGGLDTLADAVDTVIGGQLRRLKAHVERSSR